MKRILVARGGAVGAVPPVVRAVRRRGRRVDTGRWAAWGVLAPVTVYLVLFYAYPLYKNVDLSLRDYTVMSFVR